jgi:hypothetical protein
MGHTTDKHRSSKKPEGPYNHTLHSPDGHTIDVVGNNVAAGAWLELDGPGVNLSVQSEGTGRNAMNYAGYRDGETSVDTLAISAYPDGSVEVQVVLPGDGDESARIRTLSLERLQALVAGMDPEPR